MTNSFYFYALCFGQTSPLSVPKHAYGFSLSNLHDFSISPKKRSRQKATPFLLHKNNPVPTYRRLCLCNSIFLDNPAHCG